ncbi:hypothetical protein KFK09_026032 [Dendrobium nobile]|uniref:Uncharacterized protein n=1 Tax=Dendrobium nobile TaxID=94219 RepID=A0A8T3A7H6_DENNO|nr:hypothetical protein KFK09_026032 [Dendrobium nobile]
MPQSIPYLPSTPAHLADLEAVMPRKSDKITLCGITGKLIGIVPPVESTRPRANIALVPPVVIMG